MIPVNSELIMQLIMQQEAYNYTYRHAQNLMNNSIFSCCKAENYLMQRSIHL